MISLFLKPGTEINGYAGSSHACVIAVTQALASEGFVRVKRRLGPAPRKMGPMSNLQADALPQRPHNASGRFRFCTTLLGIPSICSEGIMKMSLGMPAI